MKSSHKDDGKRYLKNALVSGKFALSATNKILRPLLSLVKINTTILVKQQKLTDEDVYSHLTTCCIRRAKYIFQKTIQKRYVRNCAIKY